MKKRAMLLAVFVMICNVLVGCAPSGDEWKTDQVMGISYSAPAYWSTQEGTNYKSYNSADNSMLMITALEEPQQDLQSAYETFTATIVNKTEVQSEETTVAGQTAQRYIFEHTEERNKLKSEMTFFQLDEKVYIVILTCPEKTFSQYGEIYDTIIESVTTSTQSALPPQEGQE